MGGRTKFFVVGHWKCNGATEDVKSIISKLNQAELPSVDVVEVVLCPQFESLPLLKSLLCPYFNVAAQDCWVRKGDAYTGQTSAEKLVELGVPWVILGHSERRQLLNETDEFVGDKVAYALSLGLKVIVCIGETLEQRESGRTMDVLATQTRAIAEKISSWDNLVLAYEPAWVIGTEKVVSTAHAKKVHHGLRKWLRDNVDSIVAASTRIIYGGPVTGESCRELAANREIDGFMTETASLMPEFVDIIMAANESIQYCGLENKKDLENGSDQKADYINSVIQCFYHIPFLRKAIEAVDRNKNYGNNIPIVLELKKLFILLEHNSYDYTRVSELRHFFSSKFRIQSKKDPYEFLSYLRLEIQREMKEAQMGDTIKDLFEGHMEWIVVRNNNERVVTVHSFYAIKLEVKGCNDINDSFDKFFKKKIVKAERTTGSRVQDATQYLLFKDIPPLLVLCLRRFKGNTRDSNVVKINDELQLPYELNLDRDGRKYMSSDSNRSVCNTYILHSFVAVSGDTVEDGNCCSFIRPTFDDWYVFHDEKVEKLKSSKSLDFVNHSTSYIVIYLRKSERQRLTSNMEHIVSEAPEQKKTLNIQAETEPVKSQLRDLKTIIVNVAVEDDMRNHIGEHVHFDLVDFSNVLTVIIDKESSLHSIKSKLKEESLDSMQAAKWSTCFRLVTKDEEAQPVQQLSGLSTNLELFMDADIKNSQLKLLFFKVYDAAQQKLSYAGRIYVKGASKPKSIIGSLNKFARYDPVEKLTLYVENGCRPYCSSDTIDNDRSFDDNKLEDGDIICYQITPSPDCNDIKRFPDVPSFFHFHYVKYNEVPKSIDWIKKGYTVPVLDQGNCVICWAIASKQAIEALYLIVYKRQVPLSPQHLVDCVRPDNKECYVHGVRKCLRWIIDNNGIALQSDCQYEDYPEHKPPHELYCCKKKCKYHEQACWKKREITSYQVVDKYDEKALVERVYLQPVAARIRMYNELKKYKKGIYRGPLVLEERAESQGHAILIVGYNIENDDEKYWIIKNSWGVEWGEEGYARVLFNSLSKNDILDNFVFPIL